MPQLLIEFFSEEIPARMQKRAEEDLARLLSEKLKAAGLAPQAIRTFSSARRIGAVIDDLTAKAADVNEEKKGPRVGAPDQAIQGFLKSAGLARIENAQIVNDKKGDFYVARIERAGRETPAILQEIVPEIIRGFPWPKSMRSGSGDLTWVRPLHNILCVFGGAPVKVDVEGVPSEHATWGHRFHAPEKIVPKDAEDHYSKLRAAKVLIDREERKAIILERARALCAERKLELVEDAGLLEEVAGLAEWPIVLMGRMDEAFLDLPGEVIRLSMRTHQKYFAVRDPAHHGKLAPFFIVVANIEAKDGGDAIAAGNARVLSARLNDARFFWDTDRKTPLFTEERKAKLEKIVFHQKLGSVWDKVERVKALAAELCAVTGADAELVKRAAHLMKCDLVTETVGEFPELQGQIGKQLYLEEQNARLPLDGGGARAAGGGGARTASKTEPQEARSSASRASPPQSVAGATDSSSIEEERGARSIAQAIEDHYRPLGPNDRVPTDPVAITLALADKLDTLASFWVIGEKPTGSGDPYALRRAALGLVRILNERGARLSLFLALPKPMARARVAVRIVQLVELAERLQKVPEASIEARSAIYDRARDQAKQEESSLEASQAAADRARDLLAFLADRLKVQLRDQGKRHDLVDAVFALGDDDLVRIVARVEALDAFLKTQDGANLLAGYKRAANILAAEEKKGRGLTAEDMTTGLKPDLLVEAEEKALHAALTKAEPAARAAVEAEDFAGAMSALSALRAPVDGFFDKVLVNADDNLLRRNRLLLLTQIRDALHAVADFSKIEG